MQILAHGRLKNYAEDDLPLQLSATHRRFMLKPASVYGLDPKARARINFFLGIKVEESVSEVRCCDLSFEIPQISEI
jgi:hypothetical protein